MPYIAENKAQADNGLQFRVYSIPKTHTIKISSKCQDVWVRSIEILTKINEDNYA
jgi:hypothetical protein